MQLEVSAGGGLQLAAIVLLWPARCLRLPRSQLTVQQLQSKSRRRQAVCVQVSPKHSLLACLLLLLLLGRRRATGAARRAAAAAALAGHHLRHAPLPDRIKLQILLSGGVRPGRGKDEGGAGRQQRAGARRSETSALRTRA